VPIIGRLCRRGNQSRGTMRPMADRRPTPRPYVSLAVWLDLLRHELGDDAALRLNAAEERALLELARVAAHASERIAAPLTTFLVGVSSATQDPIGRAERIRRLTERLESEARRADEPPSSGQG
jgi:hypothetical protein